VNVFVGLQGSVTGPHDTLAFAFKPANVKNKPVNMRLLTIFFIFVCSIFWFLCLFRTTNWRSERAVSKTTQKAFISALSE